MLKVPEILLDSLIHRATVVVSDTKSTFDYWRDAPLSATLIGFNNLPNPTNAIGIIFDQKPDSLFIATPGTGVLQETRNPFLPIPTCASLVPVPDYRVRGIHDLDSENAFDFSLLR